MTPLAKDLYLAAAVALLVGWIPLLVAYQRGQMQRAAYLAVAFVYLITQVLSGWESYYSPLDNSVSLWSFSRGSLGKSGFWFGLPIGYGIPVCLAVLIWGAIANLRSNQSS